MGMNEEKKVFTITYPNGESCDYLEEELMPGFNEIYYEPDDCCTEVTGGNED